MYEQHTTATSANAQLFSKYNYLCLVGSKLREVEVEARTRCARVSGHRVVALAQLSLDVEKLRRAHVEHCPVCRMERAR